MLKGLEIVYQEYSYPWLRVRSMRICFITSEGFMDGRGSFGKLVIWVHA